jgi:hypothetical protein
LVIGIGRCGLIDIPVTPRAFAAARPRISIFHAMRFTGGRLTLIAKKHARIVSAPQELQIDRKLYGHVGCRRGMPLAGPGYATRARFTNRFGW